MEQEHSHHHHHHEAQPVTDKYAAAIAKYHTALKDDEIATAVAHLLVEKAPANHTPEVMKFLFGCIDLTSLNTTDNDESIIHLIRRVNNFDNDHPDLPNVAAICVYPNFAEVVRDILDVDAVRIACVSGGFPSSQTFNEVKIAETALALLNGAEEIDIVISVGMFLAGDYESMCDEIQELKEVCKEHRLKVILETGALKTAANIKKAAILSMYAGADFIKTSTGKLQPAATPEAAYIMCTAIREYYDLTGIRIGFKPAGGLNTVDDAVNYYTIVKEVLGKEWLTNEYFRLGTSRLANLLLSEILGEETKYF
ncbi:MAG: deoxyribose-phosphate aldolase [Prevotellaceae bacterium]|jgi:deoxyribose-phosphate aldolase|nr:deoxyribose-phosphate aldolase [Prevotellaceae bacterium]